MKISKEYFDKHFKYKLTDRSEIIYYDNKFHIYYKNNNIAIEDAPYLLIDTQEELEKFISLINPK